LTKNIPPTLFARRERFSRIPQANRVERVPELIHLVGLGTRNSREIARKMRFDLRQSTYYREAAEILGFLNSRRPYSLTDLGREFFFSDTPIRIKIVVCSLLRNSIISCVIACLQARTSQRVSLLEIEDLIRATSKLRSATTVQRRARTIIAWLRWLAKNHGIVVVSGDSVRLNTTR